MNATGFFLFSFFFSQTSFFTVYFLLLYFERTFVNLYFLGFMKAHRVQRNFSESERPKRDSSLYLYLSRSVESSVICTQVNAMISWKAHQGSVLIIL